MCFISRLDSHLRPSRGTRRGSWGTGLRFLALLLSLAVLLGVTACGGGGSSTGTITAVTISCSPASVQSGQTSQCTATVTGTGAFINTVTWAASAGAIDTTGFFTAPPATAPHRRPAHPPQLAQFHRRRLAVWTVHRSHGPDFYSSHRDRHHAGHQRPRLCYRHRQREQLHDPRRGRRSHPRPLSQWRLRHC